MVGLFSRVDIPRANNDLVSRYIILKASFDKELVAANSLIQV